MPLNPASLASGFLVPSFLSVGHIGVEMPRFAMGIAIGVCQFLTTQAKVVTADVGTLGTGTSLMPLIVPFPLIQGGLVTGFAAMGVIGVMSPGTLTGIANGLVSGFLSLALLQTNHPNIGVGSGVAKVIAFSAIPSMLQGFSSMSMVNDGSVQIASAIGMALDITFASFVEPIVIVGSASPIGGAGAGFGVII
jgi:hypothetical protein